MEVRQLGHRADWGDRGGCQTHMPFPSFVKLSLATACPQTSIIGGLAGVARILDTGHAKIEWYRRDGGRGISICEA